VCQTDRQTDNRITLYRGSSVGIGDIIAFSDAANNMGTNIATETAPVRIILDFLTTNTASEDEMTKQYKDKSHDAYHDQLQGRESDGNLSLRL